MLSKIIAKNIMFMTWMRCSMQYGLISWRWTIHSNKLLTRLRHISWNLLFCCSCVSKSFLIYVRVMDYILNALLVQINNESHEQNFYYLSRIMIRVKHCYNLVEKECLVLPCHPEVCHYLVGLMTHITSRRNSLWILMMRPSLFNSRLTK